MTKDTKVENVNETDEDVNANEETFDDVEPKVEIVEKREESNKSSKGSKKKKEAEVKIHLQKFLIGTDYSMAIKKMLFTKFGTQMFSEEKWKEVVEKEITRKY